MQQLKGYCKIPVQMARFAIRQKEITPLKLYSYLMLEKSGKFKRNPVNLRSAAEALNYKTVKSIENNLARLEQLNWIVYSPKMRGYYIRSFERIREIRNWTSPTAVELSKTELPYFHEFVYCSVLCYEAMRWIKYAKRGDGSMTELIKHGSSTSSARLPRFAPISCVESARRLNISHETAQLYKNLGAKRGYLELMPQIEELKLPPGHYYEAAENLDCDQKHVLVRDRQLVIRSVDLVRPKMVFLSRKKI